MKYSVFAMLGLLASFSAFAQEDPYEAIARATGGKVYHLEHGELNDPVKRDAVVRDIMHNMGVNDEQMAPKPGFGSVKFYTFQLVEPNSDIHGGYFPVHNLPQAGADVIAEVKLFGKIKTVSFYLLDENDKKIKDVKLSTNFPAAVSTYYMGHFIMPDGAFRVVATGVDAQGQNFERFSKEMYRAAPKP